MQGEADRSSPLEGAVTRRSGGTLVSASWAGPGRAATGSDPFAFALPRADAGVRVSAVARQAELTKPPGSLGRLEELAIEIAAWQGTPAPTVRPAAALLFAADHPVTRHGVCPFPSEVTRAMVENFACGGAAASVLCAGLGVPLAVVDVGVVSGKTEPRSAAGARLERDPVCDSAQGDLRVEDAMSPETFALAVAAGRAAVRRLDPMPRALVLGEMGIGNTTAAAAICAAILGGDPAGFVGAGTGSVGEILERKRQVVADAVARVSNRGAAGPSPREALRRLGGREIAAIYGAMLEALEQRTVVIVDGYIVTAAALVLLTEYPGAREGMVFAHRSHEQAHTRVLDHLGARPLLDLGMRLGEGSGGLVAFPIIEQACRLHAEMATFASAGVPNRDGSRG